jgi:hypothetical protein
MDALTWIQVGGIILSGAGGVAATFSETRTADKKKLTKSGWWAISLTSVGIALGLTGQVIANNEASNQTEKVFTKLQEESQSSAVILNNLSLQGAIQNQTLDDIDRVITQVKDKISVIAIYEVPGTDKMLEANTSVGQLKEYFDQYLNSHTNFNRGTPMQIVNVDISNHLHPASNAPPSKLVYIDPDLLLNEISTNADLDGIKQLILSLKNPTFHIQLNKQQLTTNIYPPQSTVLELFSTGKEPEWFINYALPSRRIFVEWRYDFPSTNWLTAGKMLSLHDISQTYCYSDLNWSAGYPDPMTPMFINFQFDNSWSPTLETFKPTMNTHTMESILPSEKNPSDEEGVSWFSNPLISKVYPP